MKRIMLLGASVLLAGVAASESFAQAVSASPPVSRATPGSVDFAGAKPFPLPVRKPGAQRQVAPQGLPDLGPAGVSASTSMGDGKAQPVQLAPPPPASRDSQPGVPGAGPVGSSAERSSNAQVAPQEFGTLNHPFTTARVQLAPLQTTPPQQPTVYSWPYRAAGKLFFKIGSGSYVCSASLIRRGLVVTAAHCVSEFGTNTFFTQIKFVPAYQSGAAPFGVWDAQQVFVLTSYLNGTETCAVYGVVCPNDVAVIRLLPKANPTYPGNSTGWFAYAWGNWGFTPSGTTLVNQLGYPVALDNGVVMQRNDSQGFRDPTSSNNTVIGSLMTGGSSGGPWLNNLGIPPVLNGTTFGTFPNRNVVMGVTSWGYTDPGPKEMGASPFTSGNIVPLVNTACAGANPACQ